MDEVARFTFFPKDFSHPDHPEAKIMQNLQFLEVVIRIANEFLDSRIPTKPAITFEQSNGPHLVIEVNAGDRDVFLRLFKTMIIPSVIKFFAESAG